MDRRNRLHTFFLRTTVIWSRVGQHIKTMSYKENELLEWAARTAEAYHSLAVDPSHQDCNLAFYTQSDLRGLTAPPELLILTINPYGDAGYTGRDGFQGQLDNDGWQAWGLHGRMTGDVLIKGNPSFGTRESWRMWRRLRNILGRGGVDYLLDDASRLVCTELIFFNTPNAKRIPKAAYALVPHTVELIDIYHRSHPDSAECQGRTAQRYPVLCHPAYISPLHDRAAGYRRQDSRRTIHRRYE